MGWVERFLRYVGRSGEHKPMADDVRDFLSHLAVRRKVAASTQNQACNGILLWGTSARRCEPGRAGSYPWFWRRGKRGPCWPSCAVPIG